MKLKCLNYFAWLDISKISANDWQILDTPLWLSEITEAIKLMHNCKSLGPEGFLVEFYKKFSGTFAPLLLEMCKQLYWQGFLATTLTQASIFVIHPQEGQRSFLTVLSIQYQFHHLSNLLMLKYFFLSTGIYYTLSHIRRSNRIH